MSFPSLTYTLRLFCRVTCCALMLSAATRSSSAQGGAPANDRFQWDAAVTRTGPEEGRFSFHGKPGFLYRLEYATTGLRSPDPANNLTANDWIPTPQLYYMPSSGTAAAQAAEFNLWLPPIVVTPPGPVDPVNLLPYHNYSITACADGSATLTWTSTLGEPVRAFLQSYDMRLTQGAASPLLSGATRFPYPAIGPTRRVSVMVFYGGTSVRPGWNVTTATTAEDQQRLAEITTVRPIIRNYLQTPPPTPPAQQPLQTDHGVWHRLFYRVTALSVDTDRDGVSDAQELDNDLDASYTGNADDPSRYDRGHGGIWDSFPNLFISEVMASNDGAKSFDLDPNSNGPLYEGDWIELYNPTDSPVQTAPDAGPPGSLSGPGQYYLSNQPGDLDAWALPLLTIAPGGRVVILCNGADPLPETPPPGGVWEGKIASFKIDAGSDSSLPSPLILSRRTYSGINSSTLTAVDALLPGQNPWTLEAGSSIIPPGWMEPQPWQSGYASTFWPATPNYIGQCDNYSFIRYARETGGGLRWGVSNNPTPGAANPVGYEGITPEPQIIGNSRGFFTTAPVATSLSGLTPDETVYYTTNGAWPSHWSDNYRTDSDPSGAGFRSFSFSTTTTLRAFGHRPGWLPSSVVTHTYIFPQSIFGTYATDNSMLTPAQQKPANWPEDTENSLPTLPSAAQPTRYKLKYGFDQATASNTVARQACLAAMDDIPIVAISGTVEDIFGKNTAGIYANSNALYRNSDSDSGNDTPDPRGLDWRRPVSFEFIPPGGVSAHKPADLTISGTASLLSNVNTKYGLRVDFRKDCRSGKLDYSPGGGVRLFPGTAPAGSSRKKFGDLILRSLSQDGWSTYALDKGTFGALEATALREDYGMSALCNAGTVSGQPCTPGNPLNDLGKGVRHSRRVHVFLNGLYWGVYALCERVDDDYMEEYFGSSAADWQVWGNDEIYNPVTQPVQWRTLLTNCRSVARLQNGLPVETGATAFASTAAAYAWISTRMDLPAYVDYILTNVHLGNFDWPANNFRFAYNSITGRHVFLPWDMERSLDWSTDSYYTTPENHSRLHLGGAAEPFLALREYPDFRTLISQRLTAHFDTAGAYFHIPAGGTASVAKTGWTNQINAFSPLFELESGRWSLTGTWLDTVSGLNKSFYAPISSKTTAFQRSEPGFRPSDAQLGDWNRATGWIRDNWFTAARIANTKTALLRTPYTPAIPPPVISRFGNKAYLYYQGGEMFWTFDGSDPMTNTRPPFTARDNISAHKTEDILQPTTFRARTRILGFLWSNEIQVTYSPQ